MLLGKASILRSKCKTSDNKIFTNIALKKWGETLQEKV